MPGLRCSTDAQPDKSNAGHRAARLAHRCVRRCRPPRHRAGRGRGAEVTAVTASVERGRRLAELGAAEVVHDVADAQGPYHLVLESTGGKNLALAAERLAHMGTLIWFGQASLEPATLSFFDLRDGPGSVTIRQFSYWDFPTPYGADLAILVRLVTAGRLHPEIGRIADWADTAATLTDLRQRRIRGNTVPTVS